MTTITLPPLRERRSDILHLAATFLKEFNKKFSKQITGFTPEAAEILENYGWRGNIREMRNVIERVVLLENATLISKESLSFLRPSVIPASVGRAAMELQPGQHHLQIAKDGVKMGMFLRI